LFYATVFLLYFLLLPLHFFATHGSEGLLK
jgi:hypothetical protein